MARRDEKARRASFNNLVAEGVYTDDFDHPPALKAFVSRILEVHAPYHTDGVPLRVIDCGCGTGFWLSHVVARLSDGGVAPVACGFDLSDEMVGLARGRLPAAFIQQGDLLNPASYRFAAARAGFDLLFAFDVVQQLPPRHQYTACQMMAEQLASGGVALIFDHDRASRYGRTMGRKKFITRYLRMPLLPRYYCDARYPPLARFAQQLAAKPGLDAQLIADDATPKRALILTKQEAR